MLIGWTYWEPDARFMDVIMVPYIFGMTWLDIQVHPWCLLAWISDWVMVVYLLGWGSWLFSFFWGAHDVHFEFFGGLMPWLILMVRGWYFYHDIMDSLDICFTGSLWQWWGDSAGLLPGLNYIFLVWRGWILWCHRWLGTTVEYTIMDQSTIEKWKLSFVCYICK